MTDAENNSLLIAFDFPLPPTGAVREILGRRPENLRSVWGQGVTAEYLREAGLTGARIISPDRGGRIDFPLRLLLNVRRTRFATALAIGGSSNLFGLLIAGLSGAKKQRRIIITPSGPKAARISRFSVAAARNRFAVLLNSDIIVTPAFLSPLIRHLGNPEVFAGQPRMDSRKVTGWTRG